MLNNTNIIRQKAVYEKICEFKTNGNLSFPREDSNGALYVVANSGEIMNFTHEGTTEQAFSLNHGQPTCICFDSFGCLYIAETANNSVFYKNYMYDSTPLIETILIKEFDDKPLKGPSSLAYNKEDNLLYVTDAGTMVNCSLFPNDGSLFVVDLDTKIMRPILYNCLSFPADVLYSQSKGVIYIAETFANRIIRLTQNPEGVFHSSVFYQFHGRLGPTALAQDEFGNLYVARFEYQNALQENDGLISVLNTDGVLIGELILPKLPEITGLLISTKKKENMYLTERNSNGILKIKLTHFVSELDKLKNDENNKFIN